ncbi:hypothetical protein AAHH79_43795, partial [Burkholderia pseudomallei]
YRHLSRLYDVRKPVDPGLHDTPIYVQFKSRQATPVAPPRKKGERQVWEGHFPNKPADQDMICATPNSALACELFID